MGKQCLECGDEFIGRADAKFCSAQCRTSFHNKNKAVDTKYMKNVNGILSKNRKILSELNPDGKVKLHKSKLTKKGFDFKYYTNQYETKAGTTYNYCYEQGYLQLEDDYYLLVTKQEYMD